MSERFKPASKTVEGTQEKVPNYGPIIACIGRHEDFSKEDEKHHASLEPVLVNYYGTEDKWRELEQRNNGKYSYVISRIDPENKESGGYANCTGMAAVGKDKETGVNVSLLTHVDPTHFSREERHFGETAQYEIDMREQLAKLKDLSEPGTVDVVLFGGHTHDLWGADQEYAHLIELTGKVSQDVLGIDPIVVVGPGYPDGNEHRRLSAVLDTQQRRLYIYRPNQDKVAKDSNITFPASEVLERQASWKNKK